MDRQDDIAGETPGLALKGSQPSAAYDGDVVDFERETGLRDYPLACPWTIAEILAVEWLPTGPNRA